MKDSLTFLHQKSVQPYYPLDVTLSRVPGSQGKAYNNCTCTEWKLMLSSGQLLAVACTDRRIQLWRVSADEVGLVLAFPRILFNGSQFFFSVLIC